MSVYDVIISGAGPVGLVLASLLSQHKLSVAIFEQKTVISSLPKAFHINQLSDEILIRLGISDDFSKQCLPKETQLYGMSMCSSIGGIQIFKNIFNIDSNPDRFISMNNTKVSKARTQIISQSDQEKILRAHLETCSNVTIFYGHQVESVVEEGNEVRVGVKQVDKETSGMTFYAKFVVGCDGTKSRVRKEIGTHFYGELELQKFIQIYLELDAKGMEKFENISKPATRGILILLTNKGAAICIYLGKESRVLILYGGGPKKDVSEYMKEENTQKIIESLIGKDTKYKILQKNVWISNQLIATKWRQGRIFLAGDAAHQWIPAFGQGLNTGYQDAQNLAWKINAMCNQWAGPYLADSYQIECRPFAENMMKFVSNSTVSFVLTSKSNIMLYPILMIISILTKIFKKRLFKSSEKGMKAISTWIMEHRYVGSNLCDLDSSIDIQNMSSEFKDLPGCRAPMIGLKDGTQLRHIKFPGLMLLSFDDKEPLKNMLDSAKTRSIPIGLVYVEKDTQDCAYRKKFYLIRPDFFIVWNSNEVPSLKLSGQILEKAVGWEKPNFVNVKSIDWKDFAMPNFYREFYLLSFYAVVTLWLLQFPWMSLPLILLIYILTIIYRIARPRYKDRTQIITRHKALVCKSAGIPNEVASVISDNTVPLEPLSVIVRVKYATLHTIDAKLCRGHGSTILGVVNMLKDEKRYPFTLGRDFVGEVVATGYKVRNFAPGDRVFGCRDLANQGTISQYISINEEGIALKPESISDIQSVSLPYAFCSALSGVNEIPEEMRTGKIVLVCDKNTVVGNVLIQIMTIYGSKRIDVWCEDDKDIANYIAQNYGRVEKLSECLKKRELAEYDIIFDINTGLSAYQLQDLPSIKNNACFITWTQPTPKLVEKYGPIIGVVQGLMAMRKKGREMKKKGIIFCYASLNIDKEKMNDLAQKMDEGKLSSPTPKIFSLTEIEKAFEYVEEITNVFPAIIQVN